jgi:L-methionine (R)-S-oxide reductase
VYGLLSIFASVQWQKPYILREPAKRRNTFLFFRRSKRCANITAALKETFGFFWVGFYIVRNDELVLGPFQGPLACTRIRFGKGVCGTAWKEQRTVLVPDVDQFPGHIACSSASRSEIVVPVKSKDQVVMVLDVDSDRLDDFDAADENYLGELCAWIGQSLYSDAE